MKPKKRQKLCLNCEGEIDLDVIVCPFCAADLRAEKPEQQKNSYSPLYSEHQMAESLYPSPHSEKESSLPNSEKEEEGSYLGQTIGGMALLSVGAQLFIFSLLLLFFSDQGALLLKWKSRFWFLYLFGSLPLLLFGYRSCFK
jgi:hypothetical protein